MRANHSPRALAVEIEISNVEFSCGVVQRFAVVAIDGAGKAVLGIVRHRQAVLIALHLDQRKNGPEYLFLRQHCVGRDIGKDGWLEEVSALRSLRRIPTSNQPAFLLADLHVTE